MWMDLLKELLYVIIVVCVPVLTKYAVTFISNKSEDIQHAMEETKWNRYRTTVADFTLMVEDIVKEVNQTYVDSLKKSGNFDKESQETAKALAINTAKALLTKDAKKAIELLYADVDVYLSTSIEKFVKENKGE